MVTLFVSPIGFIPIPNIMENMSLNVSLNTAEATRVKSGKIGRSAKFGQRPYLFQVLIIGIKIN